MELINRWKLLRYIITGKVPDSTLDIRVSFNEFTKYHNRGLLLEKKLQRMTATMKQLNDMINANIDLYSALGLNKSEKE